MLNITNAETLAFSQTSEYLGDLFKFRNIANISVKGRFLSQDLTTIADVWSFMSGIDHGAHDNVPIKLNGIMVGSGRVLSVSYAEEADVKEKNYVFDLQISSSGNMSNMGENYADIASPLKVAPYLNQVTDIAEDFSYGQNSDGTYSYQKGLSFQINSGLDINGNLVNPTESARNLALIFSGSPTFSTFAHALPDLPTFFDDNGKTRRVESFDLANNRFSFSEEFVSHGDQTPYNWLYVQRFTMDNNGNILINEDGQISSDHSSGIALVRNTWGEVETGITGRAQTMLSNYTGSFDSSNCTSIRRLKSRSMFEDECENLIRYSAVSTTEIGYASGIFHQFTNTFQRGEDGVYKVSEQGSLDSLISNFPAPVETNRAAELTRLKTRLENVIFPRANHRVRKIYNAADKEVLRISGCVPELATGSDLKLTNANVVYDKQKPSIGYTYTYTNDPFAKHKDHPSFSRVKATVSDQAPVHIVNTFNIINDKQIAQPANQSTLGTLTTTVSIAGKKGARLSNYLRKALCLVQQPTGDCVFLDTLSYSFNPSSFEFTLSASYKYNMYREFGDIFVW